MKHILCLCLTALLCCLLYTGCKQQPASFFKAPNSVKTSRRCSSCWRLSSRSCSIFRSREQKAFRSSCSPWKTAAGSPPAPSREISTSPPAPVASSAGPTRTPTKSAHWRWRTLAPSSASSHRWIRCLLPPATDKAPSPGAPTSPWSSRSRCACSTSTGSKRIPTPTTCPTMRWKIRRKSKAMPHSWSPSPFLRSRLPDFCVAQAVKSGKNGSDVV